MNCPVCQQAAEVRFTNPGRTHKVGVMVQCRRDTRHFRGFLNDPDWVEKAKKLGAKRLLERGR